MAKIESDRLSPRVSEAALNKAVERSGIDRTLLRVAEFAKSTGRCPSAIYAAIQRGEIPVIRLGGRSIRIPKMWLDRYVEEQVEAWEQARAESRGGS